MSAAYVIAVLSTLIASIIHVTISKVNNNKIVKTPAYIPLIIAFILASRNSLFWFLFGVSYDKQLVYHKFFAYSATIFGWVHGIEKLYNGS